MKNYELKAGFYEWNLYQDGELFYTFDDFTDTLFEDNEEVDFNTLQSVVILAIENMQFNLWGMIKFCNKEFNIIKNAMLDTLSKHYGIEENLGIEKAV